MIKNTKTGHVYIGQTNSIPKRKSGHFRALQRNIHSNAHMQRAYNLYGVECFEFSVIEKDIICPLVIDHRERYYISQYNSMDKSLGYNLESGGNLNKTWSIESRKARSEAMKGEQNQWFGKTGKDHPRTGKKHTEEWKQSRSVKMKGHYVSSETKDKIRNGRMGGENPAARKIINIATQEIFDTVNDAARSIGTSPSTLGNKLSGRRPNNTNLRHY